MQSGVDGRPHGAVKHVMGEQVVDSFEREMRDVKRRR
jgi:hypothetical protein